MGIVDEIMGPSTVAFVNDPSPNQNKRLRLQEISEIITNCDRVPARQHLLDISREANKLLTEVLARLLLLLAIKTHQSDDLIVELIQAGAHPFATI